jgi:hypothetical protein
MMMLHCWLLLAGTGASLQELAQCIPSWVPNLPTACSLQHCLQEHVPSLLLHLQMLRCCHCLQCRHYRKRLTYHEPWWCQQHLKGARRPSW